MAQSSPLLHHPHRLPLFTRRLNEAAGAAEMNQSSAWAWEGRWTGPEGGDGETCLIRPAGAGLGGDASRRKWSSCSSVLLPWKLPPLLSASGKAITTLRPSVGEARWGQAGGCTGHS